MAPIPVVFAVPTQGYSAAVSQTRPNDANAYTAGDVIGNATASGGAILTFPKMGIANQETLITSVSLLRQVIALAASEALYRLHLYNTAPISALGDNAAFDLASNDWANYLGYIEMGTPVDLGSTIYVEVNGYNKQVLLGTTGNLYGYLVTMIGYTPTALTTLTVTLHSQAL